jgi:hypothetical protein
MDNINYNFNLELAGIQQEMSLNILLDEFNSFNNAIREEVVLEGNIIESIKKFFKKIIDAVKKFFKLIKDKLIEFFKNVRRKITGINCTTKEGFIDAVEKFRTKFLYDTNIPFCTTYLPKAQDELINDYNNTMDRFDRILSAFMNAYQGKNSLYSIDDFIANIKEYKREGIHTLRDNIECLNPEQLKLYASDILNFINNYDELIKNISNEEKSLINEFENNVRKNIIESLQSRNIETNMLVKYEGFFSSFVAKISEVCSDFSKDYIKIYNSYIILIDCLEKQKPTSGNKIWTIEENIVMKFGTYKKIV